MKNHLYLRLTLWAVLSIVAGTLMAQDSAVLAALENSLLFQPSKKMGPTPDKVGLKYETVTLQTADKVKLDAWWVPAEGACATVLLSHGNGGNLSNRIAKLKILHDLGLNVFMYDYRGYGESEGVPSITGVSYDAQAAYDYLVKDRKIPAANVIDYGESLGGAVAAHLAATSQVGALILDSSFTSVKDMAKLLLPILADEVQPGLDTLSDLKNIKAPILILHSSDDNVVPYVQGQRLFAAASEPKQFIKLSGTHNEGFLTSGRTYTDGLNKFIGVYFPLPKNQAAK